MNFPRVLILLVIVLFGGIGVLSMLKGKKQTVYKAESEVVMAPIEIELEPEVEELELEPVEVVVKDVIAAIPLSDLPDADRINQLFNKRGTKLSFIETVTYKSRVPWMKGRPAWLSDYASHYNTSRHFIARSLNGKKEYLKQDVAEGDRFNVFRDDKDIEFHLLVDLASCKMWFYCYDNDSEERTLLKRYDVGLGRVDEESDSGSLTPLGKFLLGSKVAAYRPKMLGYHQNEKIEMVRVFGTRWIPFCEELEGCTDGAKGYGIHGLPWVPDANGELGENISGIGRYESDGCIRLATEDVEELYSIIVSKPTTIEIVRGFQNAKLPGKEKKEG